MGGLWGPMFGNIVLYREIMGFYIWDYRILWRIMGLWGPIFGIIGLYGGIWNYGVLYLGL